MQRGGGLAGVLTDCVFAADEFQAAYEALAHARYAEDRRTSDVFDADPVDVWRGADDLEAEAGWEGCGALRDCGGGNDAGESGGDESAGCELHICGSGWWCEEDEWVSG